MKIKLSLVTFILITASITFIIASCSKKKYQLIVRPVNNPPTFTQNREYFWAQWWQRTTTGHEITLLTSRLTDSAISKGIKVGLAIESEMTPFESVPYTINYSWLADTIQLSYVAAPGKLSVFAKTSMNITWSSDVFIQY